MTENEAIQELLTVLPILNFCSRPHLAKTYTAVKQVGGRGKKNSISKGDRIDLDIRHYVAMFLIGMLGSDGKPCRRTELRELFLWKWPGQGSTFEGTVMKRLRAIDAIHQDSADYPSNENLVTFTRTGRLILRQLQSERKKQIKTMLSLLQVKDKNYDSLIKGAHQLATQMWSEVRKDARVTKAASPVNKDLSNKRTNKKR